MAHMTPRLQTALSGLDLDKTARSSAARERLKSGTSVHRVVSNPSQSPEFDHIDYVYIDPSFMKEGHAKFKGTDLKDYDPKTGKIAFSNGYTHASFKPWTLDDKDVEPSLPDYEHKKFDELRCQYGFQSSYPTVEEKNNNLLNRLNNNSHSEEDLLNAINSSNCQLQSRALDFVNSLDMDSKTELLEDALRSKFSEVVEKATLLQAQQ